MKIILIILCVLAFLLLFALFLKARFRIKAESEVTLTLEVLFLKFRLFPKKEARPDPRKFSKRALEKKIAKERKKALKKQKKASAKNTKKQKQEESPKESNGSLTEKIELVLFLVKKLFSALGKRLRIDVKRLNIIVATGDAAETAVLYGAVSASAAALTEFLVTKTKTTLPNAERGGVFADFVGEKSRVDIEIVLSMRVYQAFGLVFSVAYNYLKKQISGNK